MTTGTLTLTGSLNGATGAPLAMGGGINVLTYAPTGTSSVTQKITERGRLRACRTSLS